MEGEGKGLSRKATPLVPVCSFQNPGQCHTGSSNFQWQEAWATAPTPMCCIENQGKSAPREMSNQGSGLHFLLNAMLTKQEKTETNMVKLTFFQKPVSEK